MWDGVRNYQARNMMRDDMKVGDGVLFYHSNAKPPGVRGLAQVVTEGYADQTAFDPDDAHFDPKSDPEKPRWIHVDLSAIAPFRELIPLQTLKENPRLEGMEVIRKGSRLSVQPVSAKEWREVLKMAGYKGKESL
jgi:predicted RNA-binding protein with PUA-like domain